MMLGRMEIAANRSAVPQSRKMKRALELHAPERFDLQSRDPDSAIIEAQQLVNKTIRYKREAKGRDQWEFMPEFGDCEDYALTKFMLLEPTIEARDMRIVIGRIRGKIHHAVLLAKAGRFWYVLDNRFDKLSEQSAFTDLVPLFSVTRGSQFLYLEVNSA